MVSTFGGCWRAARLAGWRGSRLNHPAAYRTGGILTFSPEWIPAIRDFIIGLQGNIEFRGSLQ